MYICVFVFVILSSNYFNQELSKPVAQTWWSGETCSHGEMLEDDGNAQATNATQLCLQQSDTDAEVCYIPLEPM